MSSEAKGVIFHGEFTSTDASALTEENSRFTMYNANKTVLSLAANERVVITDIFVLAGAALTVTLYDGANNTVAAGERILLANFATNGGVNASLTTPHHCKNNASTSSPAGYPKVKTNTSGQVDVTIRGYVEKCGQ